MILIIILILLLAYCIYRANDDYDVPPVLGIFIFATMLFIHTLFWATQSYKFGELKAKRDAFEQTLSEARKSGREYETAAIVNDVSEWNTKLAGYKYQDNHWFLGQYIDDRIQELEPIK